MNGSTPKYWDHGPVQYPLTRLRGRSRFGAVNAQPPDTLSPTGRRDEATRFMERPRGLLATHCDHELRSGDRRAGVVECGGAPPLFHRLRARAKRSLSPRNQRPSLRERKSAAAAAHSKTWRNCCRFRQRRPRSANLRALFGIISLSLTLGCSRNEPGRPTVEKSELNSPAEKAVATADSALCLPHIGGPAGYVGSKACRSCHKDQFASWHRSYHRTLTQIAAPDTVQADFHNVTLTNDGTRFVLSQRSN